MLFPYRHDRTLIAKDCSEVLITGMSQYSLYTISLLPPMMDKLPYYCTTNASACAL